MRYWALQLMSLVLKTFSLITALCTILIFISPFVIMAQGITVVPSDMWSVLGATAGVSYTCMAIACLPFGLLIALGLFAAGHWIDMMRDVERHARRMRRVAEGYPSAAAYQQNPYMPFEPPPQYWTPPPPVSSGKSYSPPIVYGRSRPVKWDDEA